MTDYIAHDIERATRNPVRFYMGLTLAILLTLSPCILTVALALVIIY